MTGKSSLDDLWNSAPQSERIFQPAQVAHLPETARRYLEHAVAPGTPLATAVRLYMRGEIRLKRWFPFSAEQVIRRDRGMIWNATVRMHGMPVRGFDRLIDSAGALQWKLFGLIPVMNASGPDIDRSAAGRLHAESVWLPSVLCGEDVSWSASDPSDLRAQLTTQGHTTELALNVDDQGRLETIKLQRWGNPDGKKFRYSGFGGVVEREDTFSGYTIPSRLRIGWYFGTDRFEADGEFFRVTIDDATYR
jgi:hypothetical protein